MERVEIHFGGNCMFEVIANLPPQSGAIEGPVRGSPPFPTCVLRIDRSRADDTPELSCASEWDNPRVISKITEDVISTEVEI